LAVRNRQHALTLVDEILDPTTSACERQRVVDAVMAGRLLLIEANEPPPIDRSAAWSAPLLTSLAVAE
jgi:hypothetical protein